MSTADSKTSQNLEATENWKLTVEKPGKNDKPENVSNYVQFCKRRVT